MTSQVGGIPVAQQLQNCRVTGFISMRLSSSEQGLGPIGLGKTPEVSKRVKTRKYVEKNYGAFAKVYGI